MEAFFYTPLILNATRAKEVGIGSPYSIEDCYIPLTAAQKANNTFLEVNKHLLLPASRLQNPNAAHLPPVAPDETLYLLNLTRVQLPKSAITTALPNVARYQNEVISVGYSGWGMDFTYMDSLAPVLIYFMVIMVLRYLMREPLARFGLYMGVISQGNDYLLQDNHSALVEDGSPQLSRQSSHAHERKKEDEEKNEQQKRAPLAFRNRGMAGLSLKNQQKILKFQNQLWLFIFYLISSIFGYLVQRHKPWFSLPLDKHTALRLLVPHPQQPAKEILIYYYYGLAFYFAESFSLIFIESQIKRSDFIEYGVHHLTTVLLIVCSHVGLEHRFGAYVLFIHDASDIMLSISKVIHYMIEENEEREQIFNKFYEKKQNYYVKDGKTMKRKYRNAFVFQYVLTEPFVNGCFVLFIIFFFYLRLYCLPMMLQSTFFMASTARHGNFNMWLLVFLLNVCLQLLHVWWGIMIIKMVIAVFIGGDRKDIRSEGDEDEEERVEGKVQKLQKKEGKAAHHHKSHHHTRRREPRVVLHPWVDYLEVEVTEEDEGEGNKANGETTEEDKKKK